jgi:hypothetical protein
VVFLVGDVDVHVIAAENVLHSGYLAAARRPVLAVQIDDPFKAAKYEPSFSLYDPLKAAKYETSFSLYRL